MGLPESGILTEKLTEVDDDVDYIYNTYFKPVIDTIHQNKPITREMVDKNVLNTSFLLSEPSVIAHEINPCIIILFGRLNAYEPSKSIIYMTISQNAINHLLNYGGNYEIAYNNLHDEDKPRFETDLSEARIKGSIHHELTHWIDDTMNNQHIDKFIKNKQGQSAKENNVLKYINTHYLERQAQIHNIKQLHRYYKDVWDKMTFSEMLSKNPLFFFVETLPDDMRTIWKKATLKRMNREGLLGKNMR